MKPYVYESNIRFMNPYNRRTFIKMGTALAAGMAMPGGLIAGSRQAATDNEFFIGEIIMVAFDRVPDGWVKCEGQLVFVSDFPALYALIGLTYGGDGTTFGLPDLRGRVPVHAGNGLHHGAWGGAGTHTLTVSELAAHGHPARTGSEAATITMGSGTTANQTDPAGHYPAGAATGIARFHDAADDRMVQAPLTSGTVGSGQPHDNMMPFLTLNFLIAVQGIFPTRT